MNYIDKTKDELIKELLELHQSYNSLQEQNEKDIFQLRLTEEQVSKSEEKFRKAFITSPDSININRLSDGMYISVNDGFIELLGYSEEEVVGKTSIDLNIWADTESRKNLVNELTENGRVENFEAIFRKKDGTIVYGLMSASIIELDGVSNIMSITKDVTGHTRMYKELSQEQSLIDALMNNLDDYIYIKDRESRFIRINKSHATALGLDNPDQVIGKTDKDFFSKEHAQQALMNEQTIINTGRKMSIVEKLTRENLPDMWVSTIKLPLLDYDGNVIGSFGISKNITEQKNLEDDLHLKQLQLEAIISNIPDQIYYKDRNSKFVLCNTPVVLLAGCTSDKDLIGKSDFDFYPHNLAQQYFDDEQILMEKGQPFLDHEEPIFSKRTGELHWNLSSKVPVKDINEKVIGLVGINRDITERKRMELENEVLYEISRGVTTTSNLDELLKLMHQTLGKVVYAENIFVALYNQETGLFSFPYFVDKIDTIPQPMSMGKSCSEYVFRTVKPFLFKQDIYDKLIEQNEVELVGSPSPSWVGIPLQTPSSDRCLGPATL